MRLSVFNRIGGVATVSAIAVLLAGCSTPMSMPLTTPVFTPAGGSFTTAQTVTISEATSGAALHCTTDGSAPTSSSPICAEPVTVYKSETLGAIAVMPDGRSSAPTTAAFTINLPPAATPVISPASGTFTSMQTVKIDDMTAGAIIYYTVDGSVPTTSSTVYGGPITVGTTETINAIAVSPATSTSAVATTTLTINLPAPTPVISPQGGTFTSVQTVAISDAAAGSTIYYSADGSLPTIASTIYSQAITVAKSETIRAIAVAPGSSVSATATAAFVIDLPQAATPVLSPAGGTFTTAQTVTLSESTAGASVYYTLDGSTPTASSTLYTAAITVAKSETIEAIAVATGHANSAVASGAFTINRTIAPPTITPPGGTFTTAQTVTISDATSGVTIYYSVDGTTPTTASTLYNGQVTVAKSETVKAIATTTGLPQSAVASATFTIGGVTGVPLSGTVKSGTTAISGSQVQMYAAGTTGYGSAPTTLLATTVTTNSTGGFLLGLTCPAAPSDQIYLVATGGDAGHGANSGIVMMVALGTCAKIVSGASVTINETTTIAAAFALSQFASVAAGGGVDIGAPAPSTACVSSGAATCNYAGLTNAFKNVNNLVNTLTGTALKITPFYATGTSAYLNSSTVPQARINTLANILASCVEATSAAACPSLYSTAKPSSSTEPVDTLQAALDIALDPGQNVAALYKLVAPLPPYTPDLSAAPNDFALALTFTGGGLGLPPGTTQTDILDTGLAIDAAGNIWVIGYDPNPTPTSTNQNGTLLAEFNSAGEGLTPASTVTKVNGRVSVNYGGAAPYDGNPPPSNPGGLPAMYAPTSIAIDQSGNAWINGVDTTEVSAALAPLLINLGLDYGLPGAGTTIDPQGDVLVVKSTGKVVEFSSDGTQLSPGSGWTGASPVDAAGYKKVKSLLFDSAGTTLWSSDQDGAGDLYQIDPVSGEITFDYKPATSRNTPLVAGSAGNIYGCATGTASLNVFNASSTSILHTYAVAGGRGCGAGPMVIDGDGHIFAYNSNSTGQFLDEFNTAGALISPPAAGYTATSSHEALVLNTPVASAIDGSGNLWVINYNTGGAATSGNVLVQFIGIAAPVVTPNSVALTNGEVAVRP